MLSKPLSVIICYYMNSGTLCLVLNSVKGTFSSQSAEHPELTTVLEIKTEESLSFFVQTKKRNDQLSTDQNLFTANHKSCHVLASGK